MKHSPNTGEKKKLYFYDRNGKEYVTYENAPINKKLFKMGGNWYTEETKPSQHVWHKTLIQKGDWEKIAKQPPSSVQDWEKELHIAMEEVRPADWYYKFIKALLKDIPRSGLAQEVNNCPHLASQCLQCGEIIKGEGIDSLIC